MAAFNLTIQGNQKPTGSCSDWVMTARRNVYYKMFTLGLLAVTQIKN